MVCPGSYKNSPFLHVQQENHGDKSCPYAKLNGADFPYVLSSFVTVGEAVVRIYAARKERTCHVEALRQFPQALTHLKCPTVQNPHPEINYLLSFEEITLKFISINEQDTLRTFLLRKLDNLRKDVKCQITMISPWVTELYLDNVCFSPSRTDLCLAYKEYDLTDGEALMNSICEVFSDEGGCPVLKSLALNNCEVGIRSLNFGICPKLEALDIAAPLMVLLELKGCGVLSEASICCPRLITLDFLFFGQLKDDCLSAATTAACPFIQT